MKKVSFLLLLIPVFLIFVSCGSTQGVAEAQKPEAKSSTAEQAVTEAHGNTANEIADIINGTASISQEEPEETTEAEEGTTEETEVSDSEAAEEPQVPEESEENSDSDLTSEENSEESDEISENDVSLEPEVTVNSESADAEEDSAETQQDGESEKVGEEDSNLEKEREEAPTTDEKDKVSEYQIFEEPELKVLDLPKEEEPEKTEPKPENPAPAEENLTKPEIQAEKPKIQAEKQEAQAPEEQAAQEKPAPVAEIPSEPQSESKPEESFEEIPVEPAPSPVPSRSVTVKIGQYLDVIYPGKGWVYIGESDKDTIFNYFGRKIGPGNTNFALRAKKAGSTLLHFYKNDALTGEYIDDYLEVTVENKRSAGRVKAPSYADIVPAKPQRRIDRANENLSLSQAEVPQEKKDTPKIQEQQEKSKESVSQNNNEKAAPKAEAKPKAETSPKTESAPKAESVKKAKAPQKEEPAQQALGPENDVKTVIQTTESNAAAQKPVANQNTDTGTQVYTYTPTSSESAPLSSSTETLSFSQIESEPVVIVEDSSVQVDESLLEKAKKDFEAKNYEQALSEAQQYYNTASTRLDEALYLLGQIWESDSSVKNIRSSVDSYDSLIKLYPASKYWKKAKNRSIYLKRFYIDIR